MAVCVPIRDLKDTAKFTETVNSAAGPVFVTKNGRESYVSTSMAEYEGLRMEAARAKLYEKVAFAEKDVAEGRVSDAVDTVAQLKARYDL